MRTFISYLLLVIGLPAAIIAADLGKFEPPAYQEGPLEVLEYIGPNYKVTDGGRLAVVPDTHTWNQPIVMKFKNTGYKPVIEAVFGMPLDTILSVPANNLQSLANWLIQGGTQPKINYIDQQLLEFGWQNTILAVPYENGWQTLKQAPYDVPELRKTPEQLVNKLFGDYPDKERAVRSILFDKGIELKPITTMEASEVPWEDVMVALGENMIKMKEVMIIRLSNTTTKIAMGAGSGIEFACDNGIPKDILGPSALAVGFKGVLRSANQGYVFPDQGVLRKADKKKKDFIQWKEGWIIAIELDFNFEERGVDYAQIAIIDKKGNLAGIWFRAKYWGS